MDTFKVMLLLSYIALLDNNLAHAFKSPFLDKEITMPTSHSVYFQLRKKITASVAKIFDYVKKITA